MHAAMHAGEPGMARRPFLYSEMIQFQSTTRMLHLVVVTLEEKKSSCCHIRREKKCTNVSYLIISILLGNVSGANQGSCANPCKPTKKSFKKF